MRCLLILALATVVTGDSMTRTITLHGNEDLGKILEETMPKKCTKNGKEYEVNEEFASGHLRYKCGKYGVYTIEGCRTEKGHDMAVGDRHVDDNVLSQCFKKGGSIYYRTTVCGTMGMPECDSIKPSPIPSTKTANPKQRPVKPKKQSKNRKFAPKLAAKQAQNPKMKPTPKTEAQLFAKSKPSQGNSCISSVSEAEAFPKVSITKMIKVVKQDSPLMGSSGIQESGSVSRTLTTGDLKKLPDAQGLPFGWHVLEEKKSNAPNTNVQLTSRTLIFNPTQ